MEPKTIQLSNNAKIELRAGPVGVNFRAEPYPGAGWYQLGTLTETGFEPRENSYELMQVLCADMKSGVQHADTLGALHLPVVIDEAINGFRVYIGDTFVFDAHASYRKSVLPSSAIDREAKTLIRDLGFPPVSDAPKLPTVEVVQDQLDDAIKILGEKNNKLQELEIALATAQFDLDKEKKKTEKQADHIIEQRKRIDELRFRAEQAEGDRSKLIETVSALVDKVVND